LGAPAPEARLLPLVRRSARQLGGKLLPTGGAVKACFGCVELVWIKEDPVHLLREGRLGQELRQIIHEMGAARRTNAIKLGFLGQFKKGIRS